MEEIVLNSGDTAWILASTALVLLMTPGLAFFYGGMVRTKSVLNMMMMSIITVAIVSVHLVTRLIRPGLEISLSLDLARK
jgi:Amt family ammonium transporter